MDVGDVAYVAPADLHPRIGEEPLLALGSGAPGLLSVESPWVMRIAAGIGSSSRPPDASSSSDGSLLCKGKIRLSSTTGHLFECLLVQDAMEVASLYAFRYGKLVGVDILNILPIRSERFSAVVRW